MQNRATPSCDECGSLFFADSSKMAGLCPECAHILYGYEPCVHDMASGRCSKCHWDGSVSPYGESLKKQSGSEEKN